MSKKDQPAFPSAIYGECPKCGKYVEPAVQHDGATLRQYYAAKAMQGLLIAGIKSGDVSYEFFASEAFALADAMIAEEENNEP